jgi:large subunit ribosomal protein L31
MKADIHPAEYRHVIFEDLASGAQFLIGSTVAKFEGKEYPKVTVEISSKSHPVYTGEDRSLDSGGQVEKFKKRLSAKKR